MIVFHDVTNDMSGPMKSNFGKNTPNTKYNIKHKKKHECDTNRIRKILHDVTRHCQNFRQYIVVRSPSTANNCFVIKLFFVC